ncbi:hypothetical protein [Uliginosibacterium gangwonense]|uniref:hypothetical protein n=1 Tax=Uliginosibacterium gangwonense TaxID=392736 RepID=UPI0003649716|nr:hypothetical protein [Uliginosibacterium gangwonense]
MSEFESGKNFQHLVIAAVAGAVCVFALVTLADRVLLPAPVKPVEVPLTQSTPAQNNAAAEAAGLEEERQASVAKQERLQKEKEQSAIDQARREQKLQEALNARNADNEQARKDAAWERFYKKPKKCDNPADNTAIVECGNHYLREQQRFEKLFADGKL